MTDITLTHIPPQTVLGLRRRGRYQEQIPQMIMELFSYVEEHGIGVAGMPAFLCHETSHDEMMRAQEEGTADIEVAIPVAGLPAGAVPASKEGGGTITCYRLPGGPMATAVHKGPYETSESAYNALFRWISVHGKTITGPIREVYLNDPAEVGEEGALTEIFVPVG
ncbi:MAG TPA: transcriptional regulator [Methanoculleus sp.]|nr:transcriptional regulator [Methanoculleus sp.]